jgi:hypothetical protein
VDLFRVSRDLYGQETLKGLSWDLLWIFFGVAAAIILFHLVLSWLRPSARSKT